MNTKLLLIIFLLFTIHSSNKNLFAEISNFNNYFIFPDKQIHPIREKANKENYPKIQENDICENSISLTVSTDNTCNFQIFDNFDATYSGTTPGFSCNSSLHSDIWFKASVPGIGELTIETEYISGSDMTDAVMQVYAGTCNNLTQVACNDDASTTNLYPKIELTSADGINPGDILYIRIISYYQFDIGDFRICAYASCGCNAQEDTTPPVITGFNNNTQWSNLGVFNTGTKDTLTILQSQFDNGNIFTKEDITVTENCNTITNSINRADVFLEETADCGTNESYEYTWISTDGCGNNSLAKNLIVRVLCDSDVLAIQNFIDTPDGTIIKPNDIITLPCGTDISPYLDMLPDVSQGQGFCNAGGRPKIRKRPNSFNFQENCADQTLIWELDLSCIEENGVDLVAEIKVYIKFEGCAINSVIDNDPIPENIYIAEQTITSRGVVNTNSNVEFKAGNSITLNTGFHVQLGGDFLAQIENISCNNAPAAIRNKKEKSTAAKSFFKSYPNPVVNKINIDFSLEVLENAMLSLFTSDGRMLLQKYLTDSHGSMIISSKDFPNGFYYLTLSNGNQQWTEKIIILK